MKIEIRFHYVTGQHSDFVNISEDDFTNVMNALNDEKPYLIINNQWINKANIITVVQLPNPEENNEIISSGEEIPLLCDDETEIARCPTKCC